MHLLFATTLGIAALLRSDGFFSGAVCFLRRTLAQSAFHGFSIGFQRYKKVCYWIPKVQKRVNLVDLVKSFQTSIYFLYLQISASIQPRTSLLKFEGEGSQRPSSRDDVVITHTSTLVGVGTHTWRTNGVLMRSSESEATSDVLQQGAGSNTVDN